ncbi:MAG: heavy metal translocating P-type ATPase metal-binding domain-containing protein [Methylococcaceae bacterium]
MATIEYKETCLLCGQPVKIDGFALDTVEGKSKFCCAGCLSIYQLLHEDTIINNNKSSKNEDT